MKRSLFKVLISVGLLAAMTVTQIGCGSKQTETTTTTEITGQEEQPPMEELFESAIPKAGTSAKILYSIAEPGNFSDKLTLATLQGLAAQGSDEQILVQGGAVSNYQRYITRQWGCSIKTTVDKNPVSLKNLLAHYAPMLNGYILASSDSTSDSGNVAISLAGLLNAAVATPDNQAVCEEVGLTCLLDVTDKNDSWLRSSEYWEQLNKQIAVEQPLSMVPKLADYAVMSKAYFSFYDGHSASEHKAKFDYLDADAVVFGYNNTLGEYDTVASFSELNINMIPSDHAYNLSTLSGFYLGTAAQKTERQFEEKSTGVHTVCLIMSDGDNVQWMMNDFTTSDKWFASAQRGQFSMGWGLPTTAIDLTAPMVSYLYDKMNDTDEFIMQLGGLGYTFPSKWSTAAKNEMAAKAAEYMKRTDLHYAEILDDHGFTTRNLAAFTKQDGIDGLFYIDYGNYAEYQGKILWSNNKPIVSARYRLWTDTQDGSIEAIARAVNAASTDPTNSDSYSFIIVHAWSGLSGSRLVPNGNTMDAVAKLVSQFDNDVEVVTPSEFMTRIQNNLGK